MTKDFVHLHGYYHITITLERFENVKKYQFLINPCSV